MPCSPFLPTTPMPASTLWMCRRTAICGSRPMWACTPQVEFKVFADGQQVYSSGTVTNETQAQSVDVDRSGVEVLQLVVDAKGSNANDQAVWGNARFTTAGNTPYLAVDDLEFNQRWQVTPENILEYVSAKDVGAMTSPTP